MTSRNRHSDVKGLEASFEKLQFRYSPSQRASFYAKMAALIRDGRPLDASLRQLLERYQSKQRPMRSLLRAWVSGMNAGLTFADASREFISETESIIIASGEKSGELAAAFEQAAIVARANAEMVKVLWTELTTTALQLVVLVCILVGFSTSVAPPLARSLPQSSFDDSQRTLFAFADVVANTWFLVIPALVGLLALSLWSMPRYVGSARKWLDRIPPWSIYRVYTSSTFMISLAALVRSGVPIEAAIRFIRAQSKPWMRDYLSEMVGRLRAGSDQGESLDVGLLNNELADTVAIYAKTGSFDEAMTSLGGHAIKTGIENIKARAGFARVMSTILIGVFVGWMFDAMMGISDAATRASNQQQAGAMATK